MIPEDLTTRRSKLETAFTAGDLELLGSLVTDHVVWATPSQAPWLGRQQVLDRTAGFFERHRYVFRLGPSQVDFDETRAVERTNYESWVDATSNTGNEPHRGSAVIVWTRDDQWKIAAYVDVGSELFTSPRAGQ